MTTARPDRLSASRGPADITRGSFAREGKINWKRNITPWATGLVLFAAQSLCAADRVELVGGDVLVGKIVSRDEKAVVLDHPVLGKIRLPVEKIKPPPPAKAAKPKPAAKPPSAQAAAEKEKYQRNFLKDWKMQASLGVSQTQGNRDTANIRLGFKTSKNTKQSRWRIDLAYALAERDGKRSENALDLGIQKDWLFPESPWFLFVESRFKSDQFKHWDHRLSLHGGLGYDLKPKHGVPITARIGGGVTKEFGGISDDIRPESLVGGELNWRINPRQKLLLKSTLYPSVESESQFRIETDAGWSIKLDQAAGLSFKLGLKHEYDSDVPPGFEKDDLKMFGSLVLDF